MTKKHLIDKITSKSAIVAVVGLGYVGLPLLLRFINSGFRVIGLDIDANKISNIMNGISYIGTVDNASLKKIDYSKCVFTNKFEALKDADAIILCVPTPLGLHREPDLSYITNTMESITPHLHLGQVLSLESTTYPGTTEEVIYPILEKLGMQTGKDIFLVYSPERENPGSKEFHTFNIPKICSGFTSECLEVGEELYKNAVEKVVPVSSIKVAEMTKLLENIHRAVNIGLVNEMKMVADRMGINIFEVIDAAATKPFGFTPYYPGPGLGGHCIPIDPFYLTWKAREYGVNTKFIELAGEINSFMPNWVVGKTVDALNANSKSVKGSNILVLGLSYKNNIDDVRESPSIILMELLRDKGAKIQYHDPYVPKFPIMRRHKFDLASIELSKENLNSMDCVVIATAHSCIDYTMLFENASLIIDTRGVYKHASNNHIIMA
jgi:UDP-N-acetyl-D-glucosamine dehydrogenase